MTGPRHVAVVGAGPAGFYAAEQLLKAGFAVDMYDLLPTPFGLVRAGVAPDHPNIKAVVRVFERTAQHEGFRFFGAVEVGVDVTRKELRERYPAVLYATGTSTDRSLEIPGEELAGVHPASEFVAWYNGHPHHRHRRYDLGGRHAAVIGNGNVALDVARMLVLGVDELQPTDTAEHALVALRSSRLEEVAVLGRRGVAQAAFTNPELRELGALSTADVIVAPEEAVPDPVSLAWLASSGDATARRNVEILADYGARPPGGKPRRIALRFLRSPVAFLGDGRVEAVRVAVNAIAADETGVVRAVPTGVEEEIPADVVFRAIGYRSIQVADVPYDERLGRIPNAGGRVTDLAGTVQPGEYVAGWVKRGPSGVIGTNKKCATETVAALLADLVAGRLPAAPPLPPDASHWAVGSGAPVSWGGWRRIDAHELEQGRQHGRARCKLVDIEELRQVAVVGSIADSKTGC
jgi:ferredoxin/flavodoxin---NADP+ reductase